MLRNAKNWGVLNIIAGSGLGRPKHPSNLSSQGPGESVHSLAGQVHGVGEQVGALERVEEMFIQHDDIRFGRNLTNRAVQLGRMFRWRHGRARHAQEDELGSRTAIMIEDAAVPVTEITGEPAGIWWPRLKQNIFDEFPLFESKAWGEASDIMLPINL